MKINEHKIEGEELGNFDSIDSTINTADMGLAMTMVSKNLYSNPIGSFIRELVSNGVDANVDANVDNPVIVHIYPEDGFNFIEVKDNGVGMSPETFKNIYMSWFNSDKRDTDEKIGGWGLGSKSPFSYQDSFEIITTYNNIKYHYLFVNEQPLPKATLILEENTSEENGTTIRVEIKEGDKYKVYEECVKQLVYFDNVYVKNEHYFYDNEFKIYEADHFKLRNKDFPYGQEMHICLGQVAYPINWNVLNIDTVNIPVALNFNIGELEVTLSREELSYTEAVKEKIIAKVKAVEESLIKKYEEQLKIDDLFDYIKLVKSDNKPPLKIKDVSIPMRDIKSSIYFNPFDDIKIKANRIKDLFSAYNVTHIKKGKNFSLRSDSKHEYYRLYRYPHSSYIVHKDINYFDSLYIEDGFLFKRGKLTRLRYRTIANALGLVTTINLNNTYTGKPIYKQGSALIVYKVLKYVDKYLKEHIQQYEGTAPKEWIEDIKNKAAQKKEDTKGQITFYNIYNNRTQVQLKELLEENKLIFYISKADNRKKIVAYDCLYDIGNKEFKKQTKFIIISPTVVNKLKKFKNVHHVETLVKVGSYKNLLYKVRLSRFVNTYLKPYEFVLTNYSMYYRKLYYNIIKYYNIEYEFTKRNVPIDAKHSESISINFCTYFKKELKQLKRTKNRVELLYESDIYPLIRIGEKLDFLNYISHNIPHNTLVKFIKTLKVLKLKPMYYNKHYKNNY